MALSGNLHKAQGPLKTIQNHLRWTQFVLNTDEKIPRTTGVYLFIYFLIMTTIAIAVWLGALSMNKGICQINNYANTENVPQNEFRYNST